MIEYIFYGFIMFLTATSKCIAFLYPNSNGSNTNLILD